MELVSSFGSFEHFEFFWSSCDVMSTVGSGMAFLDDDGGGGVGRVPIKPLSTLRAP